MRRLRVFGIGLHRPRRRACGSDHLLHRAEPSCTGKARRMYRGGRRVRRGQACMRCGGSRRRRGESRMRRRVAACTCGKRYWTSGERRVHSGVSCRNEMGEIMPLYLKSLWHGQKARIIFGLKLGAEWSVGLACLARDAAGRSCRRLPIPLGDAVWRGFQDLRRPCGAECVHCAPSLEECGRTMANRRLEASDRDGPRRSLRLLRREWVCTACHRSC